MVGLNLGVASAIAASLSVVLGGLVTDRWKRRDVRAPMWMGLIALLAPIPILFILLEARELASFTAAYFAFTLISMCWSGGFAALVQDLVLPRMRGASAAAFSLVMILISSGIGPYWAGKISSLTGSITTGLYSLLAFVPVSALLLLLAARRLRRETPEGRRARAAAAGEAL
jgi:MFS family permease